jgi:hypothetical protein
MGKMKNTCKRMIGKSEMKKIVGRPRRRWDNIKLVVNN